jgi:hypothetical protein
VLVEFGADLVDIGKPAARTEKVTQVFEDWQGALPSLTRCGMIAVNVVGIGEAGDQVGFVKAVAEFSMQPEGSAIIGDGFTMVADGVVGIAENAERMRFAATVAEFSA